MCARTHGVVPGALAARSVHAAACRRMPPHAAACCRTFLRSTSRSLRSASSLSRRSRRASRSCNVASRARSKGHTRRGTERSRRRLVGVAAALRGSGGRRRACFCFSASSALARSSRSSKSSSDTCSRTTRGLLRQRTLRVSTRRLRARAEWCRLCLRARHARVTCAASGLHADGCEWSAQLRCANSWSEPLTPNRSLGRLRLPPSPCWHCCCTLPAVCSRTL